MTDNMREFLEFASKDKELVDKINDLKGQYQDEKDVEKAFIAIAKENGFTLTEGDFVKETQEISDDELENVAGGRYWGQGAGRTSDCMCSVGGGGTADEYQKACACVLAGAGELTEYGKQQARAHTISYRGGDSDPVAMHCPLIGWG